MEREGDLETALRYPKDGLKIFREFSFQLGADWTFGEMGIVLSLMVVTQARLFAYNGATWDRVRVANTAMAWPEGGSR